MSKNKRRRNSSPSYSHTLSSAASGVATSSETSEEDFFCPLCRKIMVEPHSTICGHSFCGRCISQSLQQNNSCPQCHTALKPHRATIPNHSFNRLILKYRRKREAAPKPTLQSIVSQVEALSDSESEALGLYLKEKKKTKTTKDKQTRMELLVHCLERIASNKQEEVKVLLQETKIIEEDLKRAKEERACLLVASDQLTLSVFQQVPSASQEIVPVSSQEIPQLPSTGSNAATSSTNGGASSSSPRPSQQGAQLGSGLNISGKRPASQQGPPEEEGDEVAFSSQQSSASVNLFPLNPGKKEELSLSARKTKLDSCLSEVTEFYFQCRKQETEEDGLVKFHGELSKFLSYSSFKDLATIIYGDSSFTGTCIASCIEFNADYSMFAVGGVTQKIKIYDYGAVVRNQSAYSSPVLQLECQSKLSSVSWNKYMMSDLVCADYEGDLTLFDASTGQSVRTFKEHEKRSWSVHWNPINPNMFISASDDNKVKIWSKNSPNSVMTFTAVANVCCCRFHPTYPHVVAYGGADHQIHIADSRHPSHPTAELSGHRKTVSYLEFISNTELVSASTDSELRRWNYQDCATTKQYRGHVNEKNFVGLSLNRDYIACGSENNRCFVYEQSFGQPALEYRFKVPRSVLSRPGDLPSDTDFVSSVAWKKDSPVLLAANSHGYIKVLEMV